MVDLPNFDDFFGHAVHENKSLSKIDKFTYQSFIF